MTAQAIVDARRPVESSSLQPESVLSVVQLPELRERDFRSLEGTKVGSRPASSGAGGYRFRDPETHAEMAVRVDRFITIHLNPVLEALESASETTYESLVIVAHGMILNVLLKRLLTRFATAHEVERLFPGRSSSEWMASWKNTAYLEAVVSRRTTIATAPAGHGTDGGGRTVVAAGTASTGDPAIRLNIIGVNNVDHLQGLRKTRGGIGSAKFDTKQKTVDSFFKSTPKRQEPGPGDG